MLNFTIKPKDKVTLKSNLFINKYLCNDWANKTVVVIYTEITNRGSYITVIDDNHDRISLPVNCISRSHCLRRDHKRYSLHHKKLIV